MSIEYKRIDNDIFCKIVNEYGEWVKDYIKMRDDTFELAAMDGDFPAGFVCVTQRALQYPLEDTNEAFIEDLEVHENYRRQGIGQHLVECSETWARSKGYRQIRTHSNDKAVEAIRMWRKLNYGLCPHVYYAEEGCTGYWVAKVL